jgi:hypothetical protein
MRTRTFASLTFAIAWITIFSVREFLGWMGFGWIATSQLGTTTIASIVLAPLIVVLLTPLNEKWLLYRRVHGRDILEEERYESDTGFISLKPKDQNK